MSAASIAGAAWLEDPGLQKLLGVLSADGEEARVAGGAVRNTLLGEVVTDVDIATTNPPDETIARAEAATFKTVPTGKEHGTITVIAGGRAYEVTTLRSDIETDGRHARVVFGRDWKRDAERRDFTINALYAGAGGDVVDLVGGLADLETRTLRFIGDAEQRIREDYLRILRFFRFFAWYGSGRPDAEGIKASARLKEGLDQLSAERVWAEVKRLLSAPDPSRALLWMRQAGVLTRVLPETEKWGIDAVPGLIGAETLQGWKPDPLLRLEAIVPPDVGRLAAMADRLRVSKAEAERLRQWAASAAPSPETSEAELARIAYRGKPEGIADRMRLALASADAKGEAKTAERYARLLSYLHEWEAPSMPVSGNDLLAAGLMPGKALGAILESLEDEWVDSNFSLSRDALLKRAAELAAKG
ncbi:MAG: CCA tRNA nucleotidyltransferase [Rhizobiaceae bacterium]|nr:CCA tRNA nucleotidyltransferase [Rhizobiaceae bacterium]